MTADGPPASGTFPSPPPVPSLIGTTLDGRYRIIKLIGEGGMGEVYAAEHVHIDKKYAIKLLKQEIVSNPEAVTRFRQEARSSSSIGHRNIIAIEDFGQLADGRIYMCMELLNGAALNDMIQQPMPADRLLNILIQTGHGLAAAHAKNIVHRDMKPENIFVTIGPQGEDVPKILDFGIAKVSGNDGGNHLTRTGTIFGTPFYMAPEQALGNPVDARTDIYAVGVIMYECFAGSLPFQGESFMGILTQHITSPLEPVGQRAAKAGRQLPLGLGDIIMRCMEKDPNQRYRTMDDLVNALIGVYRGIAGPGMSTYMEAFPAGSAQHVLQPTPPPYSPTNPHAATIAAPSGMVPANPALQTGPSPLLYNPSSGGVHPVPKKSKTGLIVAIIAVVAVGGGIAAFTVLDSNGESKPQSGSGSEVAVDNDHGSEHVVTPEHGSAATTGSDHVVTPPPPVDSGSVASAGSNQVGSGATVTPGIGSDSGVESGPKAIKVTITTEPFLNDFDVFENGVKIPAADDDGVLVTLGKPRSVVIRFKGFKDKTVLLDGKKKRIEVRLDRVVTAGHPTNPIQPAGPDCTTRVVDASSKHCRDQYCARHPDDTAHGCDTE